MSYVSVDDLKVYLGIADDDDDDLLTTLLDSAQKAVETHCRRVFEWSGAAVARYFDAVNDVSDRRLWLNKDCVAVSAVVNGDGESISSSNYILEPSNYAADGHPIRSILLKSESGLLWTYDDDPEIAISVTGKWAYSLTPPNDIVQATTRLAGYIYRQKDNAGDIDGTLFSATSPVVLPAKLPGDVELLLKPYVRRTVRH